MSIADSDRRERVARMVAGVRAAQHAAQPPTVPFEDVLRPNYGANRTLATPLSWRLAPTPK